MPNNRTRKKYDQDFSKVKKACKFCGELLERRMFKHGLEAMNRFLIGVEFIYGTGLSCLRYK